MPKKSSMPERMPLFMSSPGDWCQSLSSNPVGAVRVVRCGVDGHKKYRQGGKLIERRMVEWKGRRAYNWGHLIDRLIERRRDGLC